LRQDIKQTNVILLDEVLFVVFRRKFLILGLLIVAAAIFVYGITSEVERYTAQAIVMIRRQMPSYAMPAESRVVLRREEVVNSEIEIITSPAVAEGVVDSLGLAEGANRARIINGIHNGIRAEAEPESNIIKIAYTHRNPELAAMIVNAVVEEYLRVRTRVTFDYDAVAYLDEQAIRAKAKVDSLGEALVRYGAEEGQLMSGLKGAHMMETVNRLTNRLKDVETKIITAEQTVVLSEEWLASGAGASAAPSAEIYGMVTYKEAKLQHLDLSLSLEAARAKYAPDHPEIKHLERMVAGSEKVVRQEVEQGLLRQKMYVEELKAEEKALVDVLAQLRTEYPKIAHDNMRIRLIEHELDVRADLYGTIVDRREQFRITAATDPSLLSVGVVSKAAVPVNPTKSGVNMKSVFAFFTLVFGVALVFAVERMDQSLVRRVDIERELGLKVLASLRHRAMG
jgi:uncharacterized protein involved in exopolysaccharide biosynthesis